MAAAINFRGMTRIRANSRALRIRHIQPRPSFTKLELIKRNDNFPHWDPSNPEPYEVAVKDLYPIYLPTDERPHGYLTSQTVRVMPWTDDFDIIHIPRQEVYLRHPRPSAINDLIDIARQHNTFPGLRKKSDEQWPIRGARFLISIERAASALFGTVGFGAHLNAYVDNGLSLKLWIAERSMKKSTHSGMLDNTMAGGVAAGEDVYAFLVRDAAEEANLPVNLLRACVQSVGTVSWLNITDPRKGEEIGLLDPGVLFVHDLRLDENIIPKPMDGDVEAFHLIPVHEVQQFLRQGRLKPSSASVLIDFLIRHGYVTAQNEPDYVEIISRLHRRLPFPIQSDHHV